MGTRNRGKETLDRLGSKTVDAQFVTEIREGLNCSPFEAEAVLGVVREIYGPYLGGTPAQAEPGKITLMAVSADEPAGKSVADCRKQAICLTVHRGMEDDQLLQHGGPATFRRARIPALCQEALSQGGLLTVEDLAYRILFVTPRTIGRDLRALRDADPDLVLPLRSIMHDIGPLLSHRVQIVRLALEGKTTQKICQMVRHSAEAVANYLSTFSRCLQLKRRGMGAGQIAFLLRRGRKLVTEYLALIDECEADKSRSFRLDELMRLGTCEWGGKGGGGYHGK